MTYPRKLYKFRSLATKADRSRTRQIISSSEIFFPPPSAFNDPFDCRPTFNLDVPDFVLENYVRSLIRRSDISLSPWDVEVRVKAWMASETRNPRSPGMLEFMRLNFEEVLTRDLGVLCVSSSCTDILMWSHYADSHAGICLEFDVAYDPFDGFEPVEYTIGRQPVEIRRDDRATMARKSVFTKARQWKYEKEWRKVRYEGPGVVSFDPRALTGIILGNRISPENEKRVGGWVRRSKHIVLSKATSDPRKYQMNITKLP